LKQIIETFQFYSTTFQIKFQQGIYLCYNYFRIYH